MDLSFRCPRCNGSSIEFRYLTPGLYDAANHLVIEHPEEAEDVSEHLEVSCYHCRLELPEVQFPGLGEMIADAFQNAGTASGKRDEVCRLAMDGISDPSSLMVAVRALADVQNGFTEAALGRSNTREVTALIQEQARLLELIRELVRG